jgi:hypothetical protein
MARSRTDGSCCFAFGSNVCHRSTSSAGVSATAVSRFCAGAHRCRNCRFRKRHGGYHFFWGIGLFAAATVLHFNGSAVFPIYLLLVAGFIVACALFWVVARAVFAPGRVTYHRIAGSLLLYLMIGAIFAGIYGIIGLLVPHAFAGTPPRDDAAAVVAHVLYVSFSTLSTAGGEIIASHPITRGLSNLEAIIGQLFPATLIARVVTLQLADRDRQSRFHMLSSNIDGASETQRDVRTD